MSSNTQELRNYFVVIQLHLLAVMNDNIILIHYKSSG